jgi:D-alanine--poly(phosphoribitol) ligase subunit 1
VPSSTHDGADTAVIAGPALDAPADVLDLIRPWFGRHARRPAVVDRTRTLTYEELDRQSAAVAETIAGHVTAPGSGVAVHARLSSWAIVAMLGALRAGVRYVPIDAAFPRRRRQLLHEHGDARLTLTEPGIPEPAGTPDSLAPAIVRETAAGTGPPGTAYSCFTSGSTGVPKRIDVPVAALAASTAARLAYYDRPVDAFLLCSSISFDSSVAGIYWTLACGGRIVIPGDRPGDLVAIAKAARDNGASHLLLVPSLYRLLLGSPLAERLRELSAVIVAGESCPPGLVERHLARLPRTRLYNEYGPTECTVWSTVHRCGPADALAELVPIGRPIPGAFVSVRAAGGRPAPPGEIGELWIGGRGVAVPTDHGMYRTGDRVRLREDGLLEFHGRVDEQIKVGGVRVERDEIDHVLAAQEGVLAGAVGVLHGPAGSPALTGFVVPARPAVDLGKLRAGMLGHLPAASVPSSFVLVERLPTQPNGKIDRRALDRLAAQREQTGQGARPA